MWGPHAYSMGPFGYSVKGDVLGADGFGGRLRSAREAKSLTQGQLAEAVGVQRQAVIRWERGRRKPRGEWLHKIAHALDTTVESLAGETPMREQHGEAFRAGQRDAAKHLRLLADALESGTRPMPTYPRSPVNNSRGKKKKVGDNAD